MSDNSNKKKFLDQIITDIVGTEARTSPVQNGKMKGYAIHWMGKGNDGSIEKVLKEVEGMGTWPQSLAYHEEDNITVGVFVPNADTTHAKLLEHL